MNKFQEIIFEAGALRKVCKHGEAIVRQGYPSVNPVLFLRGKEFNFGVAVSSSAATVR